MRKKKELREFKEKHCIMRRKPQLNTYISILTNLLRSDNETKSVKTICN